MEDPFIFTLLRITG